MSTILEICSVPKYEINYPNARKMNQTAEVLAKALNTDCQFHERLLPDDMLKLGVDVDKMVLHNPNTNLTEIMENISQYVGCDIDDIKYTTNDGVPSGSHHLVIPKYCMRSDKQKEFWMEFRKRYGYGKEIDVGIFGKDNWFRLPNQTGYTQKTNEHKTKHHIMKGQMRDFILKDTEGCEVFNPFNSKKIETHFTQPPKTTTTDNINTQTDNEQTEMDKQQTKTNKPRRLVVRTPTTNTETATEPTQSVIADKVMKWLSTIDNTPETVEWDDWFAIAGALKSNGYDFSVFDEFSKKSPIYNSKTTQDLWDGIKKQEMNIYTIKNIAKRFKDDTSSVSSTDITYADNHLEACNIMYERIKHSFKIHYAGGNKKMYARDRNNKWISNAKQIKDNLVYLCLNSNIFKRNEKGVVSPFLQTLQHAQAVANALYSKITHENIDETLYAKFNTTTKQKLCFKNGVLDIPTRTFKKWSEIKDGEIYTRVIIPHDYQATYDQTTYDEIINKMFIPMFGDKTNAMLYYLAKAIAGENGKYWATYMGARDCGKSTLFSLLKNAFADYVGSFNLGNIMYVRQNENTYDNMTDPKNMGWILDVEFCRLIVSQEVPEEKSKRMIHGETLKKIMSGGDDIHARRLYEDQQSINVHFGMLIMGNYATKVDDIGVNINRLDIAGDKSFTTQEKIDQQIKDIVEEDIEQEMKDVLIRRLNEKMAVSSSTLANDIKTEKYACAILHILLDYYHRPVSIGSATAFCAEEENAPKSLDIAFAQKYKLNGGDTPMLMTTIYDDLDKFAKKNIKLLLEGLGLKVAKHKSRTEYPEYRDKMVVYGVEAIGK